MRLILLWSCLAMMIAEAGAVSLEVHPEQMIPVPVSRSGLSRISLSDGHRISNVWGRSSMVEIETDSTGGQVFIKPRPGAGSFALYLRDEKGTTYSLMLSPVDSLPDSILLLVPEVADEADTAGSSYLEDIAKWMWLLARNSEGDAVAGYLRQLPWWQDTRLYLLGSSRRRQGILAEHYQLVNTGDTSLRLYEAEFARIGDVVAVSLDRRQLPPGETANIYLLRRQ